MKKLLILLVALLSTAVGAHAQTAWAGWCSDNKTLYFGCTSPVPSQGGNYTPEGAATAVTLTNVWSGTAVTNQTSYSQPWSGKSITAVVVQPSFKKASLKSLYHYFYYMSGLKTITGLTNMNTANVTSMEGMFYSCGAVEDIDMSSLDVRNVTTLKSMFSSCSALKTLNLSGWQCDQVTVMSDLFYFCGSLVTLNLEGFTAPVVNNISNMFLGCTALKAVDLSGLNTSNVKSFSQVFTGCKAIEDLDLSAWDSSGVSNFGDMFRNCSALKSVNISGFDMSKATYLGSMFENCTSLETVTLGEGWRCENVTNMSYMFNGCSSLRTLNLAPMLTLKLTATSNMFNGCSSLESVFVSNGWTVGSVTSSSNMFRGCTSIVGEDGTTFDASSTDHTRAHYHAGGYLRHGTPDIEMPAAAYAVWTAEDATLRFVYSSDLLFAGNSFTPEGSSTPLTITASWNGEDITNTYGDVWRPTVRGTLKHVVFESSFSQISPQYTSSWFQGCSALEDVQGMQNLNTSSTITMGYMFDGCASLRAIDLSHINSTKIKSIERMFQGCSSLESVDLSSYNDAQFTSIFGVFNGCSSLKTVNMGHLNTAGITTLFNMFTGCAKLKTLDLSALNTLKVTDMRNMFSGCSSLESVYVGTYWSNFRATNSENMFLDCTSIVGEYGTTYDANYTTASRAHYGSNGGYLRKGTIETGTEEAYAVWSSTSSSLFFLKTDAVMNEWGLFTPPGTTEVYPITYLWSGEEVTQTSESHNPDWQSQACNTCVKVVICPTFAEVRPQSLYGWFYNFQQLESIEGLQNLNTSQVTTMDWLFAHCKKLPSLDVSRFNTLATKSMRATFCNMTSLTTLDLSNFMTSGVTDMANMFSGCSALKTILASSGWNTSAVTSSSGMFNGCVAIVGQDGTTYDASAVDVTRAHYGPQGYLTKSDHEPEITDPVPYVLLANNGTAYFVNEAKLHAVGEQYTPAAGGSAVAIEQVIAGENATTYEWHRNIANKVKAIVIEPSFATIEFTSLPAYFNDLPLVASITGLENLRTERVTDMSWLFGECPKLTTLDLTSFNTARVTDMSSMFEECTGLESVYVSSTWSMASINDYKDMFFNCLSIVGQDGTTYDENHVDGDRAHYGTGGYLRKGADVQIDPTPTVVYCNDTKTLYFYVATTPVVQGGMFTVPGTTEQRMAARAVQGESVTKGNPGKAPLWIVANTMNNATTAIFDASFATVRPQNVTAWFYDLKALTSVRGMEYLNTEEATDMSFMFYDCAALGTVDLSHLNTSAVTNMEYMFGGCSSMRSLNLSHFDTDKVENMRYMFSSTGLTSLDLSSLATGSVTNMDRMFAMSKSLTSLDLTGFDTRKVTRMGAMFFQCSALHSVDLSSFNTALVTDMEGMFGDDYQLEAVYVGSDWTTAAVTSSGSMFRNCTAIVGEDGTRFDENYTDATRAYVGTGGYLRQHHSEYAITLPASGFITFSAAEAVALPEGLAAYVVTKYDHASATATATLLTHDMVPAEVGVLLRGNPNAAYTLVADVQAQGGAHLGHALPSGAFGNKLLPTLVPTQVSPGRFIYDAASGGMVRAEHNLVLVDDKFIEIEKINDAGVTSPANSAYLSLVREEMPALTVDGVGLVWVEKAEVKGDVNGDGVVSAADLSIIVNILAGLETNEEFIRRANVNGDQAGVSAADIAAVVNILAGLDN